MMGQILEGKNPRSASPWVHFYPWGSSEGSLVPEVQPQKDVTDRHTGAIRCSSLTQNHKEHLKF
jgi:hypothetical protein